MASMIRMSRQPLPCILMVCTILYSCGGGDDDQTTAPAPPNPQPNFANAILEAYVKSSNPGGGLPNVPGTDPLGDLFGSSIAMSGDTMAVGAPGEDSCSPGVNGDQSNNLCPESGAVYVFTRMGGVWRQQAYIKSSNPIGSTGLPSLVGFGASVALSGDTLAIGAPGDLISNVPSGAVYVFTRTGDVWQQEARLAPSHPRVLSRFGNVALSGDTLAVGAPGEWSCATGINGDETNMGCESAGAAFVYTRIGKVWTQEAYIKAPNTDVSDHFGGSVVLHGETFAVGAPDESSCARGLNGNQSDNSCPSAGAGYVFIRSNGVWTQEAYVKASNTARGHSFTISGLSDDMLVASAPGEDSCATGVNDDQGNTACPDAGALYAFTRVNGNWIQDSYLKASDTAPSQLLGSMVALSGDTIVAGTASEDSCARGINGDPFNTGCPGAGAVYVFVRNAGTWHEQAYVKAPNTEAGDSFGAGLALDGNTLVVGAYGEDSNATGFNGNQADNSLYNAGATYVYVAQ